MDKKVLVVDDDSSIRMSVQMVFEDAGYQVTLAESGKNCLEILKNGYKGIILMDIMMPIMTGWETIQAIVDQNLHEGNIIAMLSAKNEADEQFDSLKEFIADYLSKPFEADELIAIVDKYVSN
ncbi:response regulator [Thermoplasmatales archaeon ex4572_165]|nr:MAG: response regulator [Thermoplasmatales archaeon ex4572_165]